jgi:hypothetical protein
MDCSSILATQQQGFIPATFRPYGVSIYSGNTATRIHSSNVTAIQTLESFLATWQQGSLPATFQLSFNCSVCRAMETVHEFEWELKVMAEVKANKSKKKKWINCARV